MQTPRTADVLIVGAGSAGCVLAERLSRDPGRQVVLAERGPSAWPDVGARALHRLPLGADSPWARSHDEKTGLGVVRGSGLGGSSVINGGYFLRWHRSDFDDWPAGWRTADVEAAYRELDGPGGTMTVSPFAEQELPEVARAFESYWAADYSVRNPEDPWPIVGVNRVRSNRTAGLRMTAAEAYLRPALDRPNLQVCGDSEVVRLTVTGATVTGAVVGESTISAGEVILSAGTLGTGSILLRSGIGGTADRSIPVWEDREVLVGYRSPNSASRAAALLPTVLHTDDALELRCYSGDMADYIDDAIPSTPVLGVSAMRPGAPGEMSWEDGRLRVLLGQLDGADALRLEAGAASVVAMLRSPEFRGLVEPDSVSVGPVVRNSQHAWGSFPMGTRTDDLGRLDGTTGLRIVDGSILPTGGRSGPHATIMMVACHIGDRLIGATADR